MLKNIQHELKTGFTPKIDKVLLDIELDKLIESDEQLRIDLNNIEELAQTLQTQGQIQAIAVKDLQNGFYMITDGHRRWEAAKLAGWKTILAQVVNAEDNGILSVKGLVANIQREDLSAFELALAVDRAMAQSGLEPMEFAKHIGKSIAWVSKNRAILNLPQEILDSLALEITITQRRRLGLEALSELSRIDEELAIELFNKLKNGEINREGMREAIKEYKTPKIGQETQVNANNTQPQELTKSFPIFEDELKPVIKVKIGCFYYWHTLIDTFGFDAFSFSQKTAFKNELEKLLKKYENMERE